MKLFIANCTHQIQTVNYRLIEGKGRGFQTQHIGLGRQEQIAGELNKPQIDGLIGQLRVFGLHEIEDLPGVKHFVPIVCSVDKAVPAALMQELISHNTALLKQFGTKLRREAAIATSHGMREFSPMAADTVALSVEEEKPGTMDHGGEGPMAEGFRMNREALA